MKARIQVCNRELACSRIAAAVTLTLLCACAPAANSNPPVPQGSELGATSAVGDDAGQASDTSLPSLSPPSPEGGTGGWRLLAEDSPYLRQHADNPVAWHPWGEAAFALAAARDVPVFLSIGYSSCHWCHVMEHESFEDEEIAAYLNAHFVCIKVDREQRPDVDDRYMAAVQAMTGSGGWPLSAWLTTEGEPFLTGTYFPPRATRRMPGFIDLCQQVVDTWDNERDQLMESVAHNAPMLRSDNLPPAAPWAGPELLDAAASALVSQLDPVLGGMAGKRPQRFPPSSALSFLLRQSARGAAVDLEPVHVTLDAMAKGGMRDHVAGGFHRYSTDPQWHVPHFEKMLYDNAQLAEVYAMAYAVTGEARHARVARDTLAWLAADMRSPEGLYYSARDADSLPFDAESRPLPDTHPEEGDVNTWTPAEVLAVLGDDDGAAFNRLYGITAAGNFERGRSIPRPGRTDEQLAADPGEGVPAGEAFYAWQRRVFDTLASARAKRPQAFRDEKCLTAWNGLLLSGLAASARSLDDEQLAAETARLGHAVLERLTWRDDDSALRVWHQRFEGRSSGHGDLADHSHLARGLLEAHGATGEPAFLAAAWELAFAMIARFEDTTNGGFHLSEGSDPLLPTRGRELQDGAIPSSQSVATGVMLRLAPLDDSGALTAAAERVLERFASLVGRSPRGFPSLAIAVDAAAGPLAEVVLTGTPGDPDYDELRAAAQRAFLPAELLLPHAPSAAAALAAVGVEPTPALLQGRTGDEASAWICVHGACLLPVTNATQLMAQWSSVTTR
ncbi:MAG: thioredoxin domain-containing protein [Planctomycetota bacterium]|nr:MAG: thioredoxin domain-containing protein [Planctomycetota bacterium]